MKKMIWEFNRIFIKYLNQIMKKLRIHEYIPNVLQKYLR